MKYTSRFSLTRRELVMLTGFAFAFLFVAPTKYVSDATQCIADEPNLVLSTQLTDIHPSHGALRSMEVVLASTSSFPDPRLTWTESIPETEILHHTSGGTIFDRLYILNGTLFVVTSKPELIPERKFITSTGCIFDGTPENHEKRMPTDKDIRIITPAEAQQIFNTHAASRLTGTSFLVTDSKQYVAHYYHFTANILFELWRTYTALDPTVSSSGRTSLPAPARLLFRNVAGTEWRDYAKMDQWIMHGAFPNIGMGFSDDWNDRAAMAVPFVFDRVVISDRAARQEGDWISHLWWESTPASELRGVKDWWKPIRSSMLSFSGLAAEWMIGPTPHERVDNSRLVITYVSRQDWGRRMLRPEDHTALVNELHLLRDRYGYEVNVVSMDKLSRAEQMQLAGRTTILMGVHGNGLTALLWMQPTERSTVIEFFYPEGFTHDYQYPSRALGVKHFGVWNDRTFTYPDGPHRPIIPDGFQGNAIPVNGATVSELVLKRLTLEQ